MKVQAIKPGYLCGKRRRVGDVFEVPDGKKASWFSPVGEIKAPAAAQKGKAKKEPETLSEIAKAPVVSPEKADDLV